MSRDLVSNDECWVTQRRGMKDDGVGLERLFKREIAWNCEMGAQHHRDVSRGLAE